MAVGAVLTETSLVLDNDIFNLWRYGHQRILGAITDYQSRIKLFPFLTSMTVYQALYGIENKSIKPDEPNEQTKQTRVKMESLIRACGDVLPFNQRSAEIAAYIAPRLSKNMKKGTLVDVFIAATALAHGYGVATRNRKDFELIANQTPDNLILRLAEW